MTLTEFRRKFRIGSTVFHVFTTIRGQVNELYTVVKVQTNGVYMKSTSGNEYWFPFPRLKQLQVNTDGFTIVRNGGHSQYLWQKPGG